MISSLMDLLVNYHSLILYSNNLLEPLQSNEGKSTSKTKRNNALGYIK